jgi:ketosteroid isomerase-like protein
MRTPLISAVTFCLLVSPVSAQKQGADSEVRQFLAKLIRAFDDLDWGTFRHAFSDDATVFYPRSIPERAEGRTEFEREFKLVFEQIQGGRTKPPYMDIQPRNMKIQIFGAIAIVSFHLDDRAGFLNRRTLVIKRTPTGWKIVHLHASEVAIEP